MYAGVCTISSYLTQLAIICLTHTIRQAFFANCDYSSSITSQSLLSLSHTVCVCVLFSAATVLPSLKNNKKQPKK